MLQLGASKVRESTICIQFLNNTEATMYFISAQFYQVTIESLYSYAWSIVFGHNGQQNIEVTESLLELHLAERRERRNRNIKNAYQLRR